MIRALLIAAALLGPTRLPSSGAQGTGSGTCNNNCTALISVVSGTPVTCSGTGNATITCTIPASTYQTNDIIVALFSNGDSQCGAPALTNVSGAVLGSFTRAPCTFVASGSASIWYKVATGNQAASTEAISLLNDDGSGGLTSGAVYVVRGANTAGPFNLTTTGTATGTAATLTLTTQSASFTFVALHSGTSATTLTPNSDTTCAFNTSGNGQGNALCISNKALTTATLGGTWGASNTWVAAEMEIRSN
jgi:hypothetical protein